MTRLLINIYWLGYVIVTVVWELLTEKPNERR